MNHREIRRDARELIADGLKMIELEPWEEDYDDPQQEYRRIYLGTVFCLTPSGKYYMPWAFSNVDPCPRCKGEGCDYCWHLGSREAAEDQMWQDAIEEYSDKHGVCVCSGEGDPCDILMVAYRDKE